MLDIYCDSSYNEDSPSFIGCVILADGLEVHQSTSRVLPDPKSNLECEIAAIELGMRLARVFRRGAEPVVIYNDNTEAVKAYLQSESSLFPVEFTPRESQYQSMADRLSKRYSQKLAESHDLCKKPVESFTPEILRDIGENCRAVLYLVRDAERSTNTKSVYRLIVRAPGRTISDDRIFEARSGEVKNVKVARDVSTDLAGSGLDLAGSYFLLTDETWGLRLKGGEAYSILPCTVPHRIICHEVDRSPENLWRRVGAFVQGETR
jgi:hypothetical protein